MGAVHDNLTNEIGTFVLNKIRVSDPDWRQVFSTSVNRIGSWDWPRADYIMEDNKLGITYAHEFKPPFQTKREYLTGLGQSMCYLNNFDYAGIIVPKYSDDNFKIAEYMRDVLSMSEFLKMPISIIEYDYNNLYDFDASIRLLRPIQELRSSKPSQKSAANDKFWMFWRDMTVSELYLLLTLCDKYNHISGDVYTSHIWPEFWQMLINGQTSKWDGKPRKKAPPSPSSESSEKQNYKIPLFQMGLIDQAEGRLTKRGYRILYLGKQYGYNSIEFLDYVTYLILTDGKHMELINEIEAIQQINSNRIPSSNEQFLDMVYKELDQSGLIKGRKSTKTGKKPYFRDEPKLWNNLGLINRIGTKNYFRQSEGYYFNWRRITEILSRNYPELE